MSAESALRRYLVQRQEAGEREIVLESLTGANAERAIRGAATTQSSPAIEAAVPGPGAPAVPVPFQSDWRAVLRAVDAAPRPATKPAGSAPTIGPEAAAVLAASAQHPLEGAPALAMARAAAEASTPTEVGAPAGIVIGSGTSDLFGRAGGPGTLDELAREVAACRQCALHATALSPVPGEGSATARLVCVGEAPGATEDETGRPFVGAAGQLLTKILAAIDLKREDVFICNVLKHRPPNNRNPRPEEITACSPYLIRQLEILRPRVILALGTFAAQTLLNSSLSMGKLRGAVHRYYGIPLIVTYHPAALLRNPAWRRPTWEDVQLARRILDSAGA